MSDSTDYDNPGSENEKRISLTAREWVIRLASGEISGDELHQFKSWLAEDPSHQEAFDRERLFWQQLDRLEDSQSWDQDDPQQWTQPYQDQSLARRRFSRTVVLSGLTAACLALVFLYPAIKMFLLADYHTSVGEQTMVTLPDGGTAYLNTDSAIALTYAGDERRIDLLRGEAFFEVVPNKQKPFRVIAQDGVTEAVGTAFVVRAEEQQTSVTVTEGTVTVSSAPNGQGISQSIAVHAGERTIYHQGEAPQLVETIDRDVATAWVEGTIVIEGQPFEHAIAEIDRYRPGRIVVLADLSHAKPVSGRFTLDGIDEAIGAFAATQGFTVLRVTDYLVFIL